MASEEQTNIKLCASVLTDVGVVRDHNEDSAHVDASHQFFIVADGMGGHAAGEVASAMAVDTVRAMLEQARPQIKAFAGTPDDERRKELVSLLERAVRAAHQAVFERGSRETDKQGMGTTLDVVLVAGPEAFVAHVGDSRTYLIRDGQAAQVTTDHTVAEVLVIEGKLSAEEAQMSPLRTILVNAIGVAPDVGIEMAHVQLRAGDQLLLCSDGLHDYFPLEQELADRLSRQSPEQALAELIELAKERGGHDNITGIIAQVVELDADEHRAAVPAPVAEELSDGIPASVDLDDTAPVDEDQDDHPGHGISGIRSLWTPEDDGDEDPDDLAERPTQPIEVVRPPEGFEDSEDGEDGASAKAVKAAAGSAQYTADDEADAHSKTDPNFSPNLAGPADNDGGDGDGDDIDSDSGEDDSAKAARGDTPASEPPDEE